MKKSLSIGISVIFLLGLLALPGIGRGQEDLAKKKEEAKTILEKMIEVQGGRQLLESITDTTSTASIEMVTMGMSGSATLYHKEPGKMRMDIEVMGMVITQAFDGQKAWWVNPQTSLEEEMPESATQDLKRQALTMGNKATLDPDSLGIVYTHEGTEAIDGKDYLVLKQILPDGFESTIYVDPSDYLTFMTKATIINQMGTEVESVTHYSDYRDLEGMKYPFNLTVYQAGEEFMSITMNEIKFNSGLEDSLFQMSK